MPWCPICRYEYIDGISECPECGVAMLNEFDQLPDPGELLSLYPDKAELIAYSNSSAEALSATGELPGTKLLGEVSPTPEYPVALLFRADNAFQGDELMALLQSSGIPALTSPLSHDYFLRHLTGRFIGQVGVYVAESRLEEAKALLGLDESPIPFLYLEAECVEPDEESPEDTEE